MMLAWIALTGGVALLASCMQEQIDLSNHDSTSIAPLLLGGEEHQYGSGHGALFEWPDYSSNSIVPQHPNRELQSMLSEVDSHKIRQTIAKLVSFGTRHTMSTQANPIRGIGAARDWISAEFAKVALSAEGRMDVTVESYEQEPVGRITQNTKISNVITTIRGSGSADAAKRVYVITGHYDSINSDMDDFEGDAPGANDDASGVAVVLELARIMAKRAPRATIILGAVAGEEQGLYGSSFMAKGLKQRNVDVQAMINNDIVGSPKGPNDETQPNLIRLFAQGLSPSLTAGQMGQVSRFGEENDSPSRQIGRFIHDVAVNNVTQMEVQLIYRTDRYGRNGDHSSFLAQNFPAVRFVEPVENFAHQHQNVGKRRGKQYGDSIEFVDMDYVSRVAKVNMAALWSLANGPGIVKRVRIRAQGINGLTNITFANPKASEASACELVWRPTVAHTWTHTQGPQPCSGFIVTTVNQDNVVFGVRAIGSNGLRGPVAAVSSFA